MHIKEIFSKNLCLIKTQIQTTVSINVTSHLNESFSKTFTVTESVKFLHSLSPSLFLSLSPAYLSQKIPWRCTKIKR